MKKTLYLAASVAALATTAHADGELNLYVWSDSISPELIQKFEAETATKVNMDGYNSNEDLLTKLQAGSSGYDLVMPSQHFVRILIDQGLAENIGAKDLSAFQQVDERWRGQWWDETNEYSVPFAYGTAGYTVNRNQ